MKMPDIQISSSNNFIELQALMTERDGMTADNLYRQSIGIGIPYCDQDFQIVAEKMRALKTVEAKPEHPTTSQVTPCIHDWLITDAYIQCNKCKVIYYANV